MKNLNKKIISKYLFVSLIFFSVLAFGEKADREKPIEIVADTMLVDDSKNTFS